MDSKELTEKVRAHLIDKHGAVRMSGKDYFNYWTITMTYYRQQGMRYTQMAW